MKIICNNSSIQVEYLSKNVRKKIVTKVIVLSVICRLLLSKTLNIKITIKKYYFFTILIIN